MSTIKVNRILTSSGGEGVDADIIGNVTGNVSAPASVTVGLTTFHSTTALVHNINSTGVITATSFSGNGSSLTGISAGYWESTGAGINTTSNVGIGTDNPGQKLTVQGTTSLMATNSTNQWMAYTYTDNTFRLNYNGASYDEITVLSSGEVGVGAFTPGAGDGILQIAGGLRIAGSASASDTNSPYIYRTSGADNLNFATSGVERLRITSSGTVGIGTDAPSAQLQVQTATGTSRVKFRSGDSNAAALYLQNSTTGSGNSDGLKLELGGNEEAYIWMMENAAIRFGTSNSERMSLLASGYFGINKTAPATQLHVRGQNTAARGQVCIEGQDVSARLTLYQGTDFIGALKSSADSVDIAVETGHEIRLITNNTNRLIVKDGGDIELGNNVRSRGSDNGFTFGNKATHTDNTTNTQGSSFSKTRGRFDSCQNTSGYNNLVLRHTHTSSVQYMVEFFRLQNQSGGSGNFGNCGYITTTHTGVNYQTASDYRLKENVVALTGAIDRVKQLQPKRFNFKLEPGKVVDGFMAHEAQTVVPESVSGTKDEVANFGNIVNANGDVIEDDVREPEQLEEGETWVKTETKPVYQGIDSAKLVPLLTAALQEAIAEIETLKTKVAALEGS